MGKFIETRLFKLLQNSNYTKSELNMSFNNLIDELIKCYSSNSELHQAYKETQRALYFLISLESEIKRDKSSNEEMIQHRLIYIKMIRSFLKEQVKYYKYLFKHGKLNESKIYQSQYQWTSSKSDLVELAYALTESKCINNGDTQIEKFTQDLAMFFGLEVSKSSRIFTNIKLRKAKSRTFFLDKLAEKLNYRMNKDDEK